MSVCIARTEEGLRKGERVLKGVRGEVLFRGSQESSRAEESSADPCDVRGELQRDCSSNTASSGPLE